MTITGITPDYFQCGLGIYFVARGIYSLRQSRVPMDQRKVRGRGSKLPLGTGMCIGIGVLFTTIGAFFTLEALGVTHTPTEYFMLGIIPLFLLVVGCFVRDRVVNARNA